MTNKGICPKCSEERNATNQELINGVTWYFFDCTFCNYDWQEEDPINLEVDACLLIGEVCDTTDECLEELGYFVFPRKKKNPREKEEAEKICLEALKELTELLVEMENEWGVDRMQDIAVKNKEWMSQGLRCLEALKKEAPVSVREKAQKIINYLNAIGDERVPYKRDCTKVV